MSLPPETLKNILTHGEITLQGQFMLGSNYTFLVHVHHEEHEVQAVYKPSRGEQPLWDFPENTLALREVAAYHVSEALGWGLVPFTTFREDGPYGPGSLQQFIDYNPNYHYFTFKEEDKARLRPVALFDLITNNADRKGSHVLIQKRTRRLYAIDHGLCFNVEDKLRTVLWDYAGESISAELVAKLEQFRAALSTPNLRADLEPYLSADELDALETRTHALISAGIFPFPPKERRAIPWPPL